MFQRSTARQALSALVDRLVDRIFAAPDARALARGWTVTRTCRGRIYRDPRWDRVERCRPCAGRGFLDALGSLCPDCRGDGAVRRPVDTDALDGVS